jgi:hypothetical protein
MSDIPDNEYAAICEFFRNPDARVCGLPVGAAEKIFNTDNWFNTVPANTMRYVSMRITQDEKGRSNLDVDMSRDAKPGFYPIDVSAVQSLGRRVSQVNVHELLVDRGLFLAFLFSVVGNKKPLVWFARWYQQLNQANKNIERLSPRSVKAARVHIAWLEANCSEKCLQQAKWDPVVTACGTEHPFPCQADLDTVPENPEYITKYLALWNPNPPTDFMVPMTTDFVKFEAFTEFLLENPDLEL